MTGPCLCGDPYCHSCGTLGAAEAEAEYDWVYNFFEGERSVSFQGTCAKCPHFSQWNDYGEVEAGEDCAVISGSQMLSPHDCPAFVSAHPEEGQ